MLSSLPSLIHADPNDLWYTPLSAPTSNAALSASQYSHDTGSQTLSHLRNQQHHSAYHAGRRAGPSRSILSDLRADENAIQIRKGNIRRFGAGWIKPPGVVKTLQAMDDERAEREEQELNAQREAALAEAQQAQEEAEEEERQRRRAEEGGDEGMMEGERDLDADIPEADEVGYNDSDDGEEGDYEGEDDWEDDSEGALTPVEGEGDYAEAGVRIRQRRSLASSVGLRLSSGGDLGMDADLDAGEEERDLDDDVPEAGSYEHTDTEAEDQSDEDEADMSMIPGQAGITGSSVFGSSPANHVQYGRRSSSFRRQ